MAVQTEASAAGRVAAVGKTRAVIIDDQLVFRLGLRLYLSRTLPEIVILGETDSAAGGLRLADRVRPDLAVVDASLPDSPTDEIVAALRKAVPHCRLVVLANSLDPTILRSVIEVGVEGCMLKTIPPEQMAGALRCVIAGGKWVQPEITRLITQGSAGKPVPAARAGMDGRPLTRREMDVLRLIADGLSNAQIAHELSIGEQTVKTHVGHLMRKIDVRSRLQAARYAIGRGLAKV